MSTPEQRNEDLWLGKLAVRDRLCTPEQIEECLRMQANGRQSASLGDILVYKGYLTEAQVHDLRTRRQKKVMACTACALSFTVLTLSDGRSARCPKCKGGLVESSSATLRTDAEFSTRRVPVIPSPSGPKLDLVCVICDHAFQAGADVDGRVRCPACQSTFRSGRIP